MNVKQFLFALGLLLISSFPVQGQPVKKSVTESKSLKNLYTSMRHEKYLDAREQAESILKTGQPHERLRAGLVFGRILFSLEKTEEAAEYLKKIRPEKLEENEQQLLKVYQAWLLAQQGHHEDAITALKAMLKRGLPMASTAEAADVLALLYLQNKERDKAGKVVKFGLDLLAYHDLKTSYIEQILKNRLRAGASSETGEGIALYKKGEELREAEKFVEAGKVFMELQKRYPQSQWSHAAGFRIGQCLVRLDNITEAKGHWKTFLKQLPTGPWRGQAHLGLVEIAVRQGLDLTTARERLRLATSALAGALSNDARDSWNQAAPELHLQTGLLACAENDFPVAAAAFLQAQKLTSSNTLVHRSLPALMTTCKTQQRRLPTEFLAAEGKQPLPAKEQFSSEQLAALLTLALLENQLERFEQSADLLDSLANRGLLKTPAIGSFALLLKGHALHGLGSQGDNESYLEAHKAYLTALSAFPSGSWQDETLYRTAILAEQLGLLDPADLAVVKTPPQKKAPADPAKRIAESRRMANRYWQRLLDRYPASPYAEAALYHTGDYLYTTYSDLDAPATNDEKWNRVIKIYSQLIADYPQSGWVGDAQVKLIDIQLERLFLLPVANRHAELAIAWLKQRLENPETVASPLSVNPHDVLSLSAAQPGNSAVSATTRWKRAAYDIYVRAGLVAYLQQDLAEAATRFEKAKPYQPDRSFVVVYGTVPTGIERLISTAKQGKTLTPQSVLEGDSTAKLILMLADVYHVGRQSERALELCSRVLKGSHGKKATRTQKSYAFFRRGRSRYHIMGLTLSKTTREQRDEMNQKTFDDYISAQKTAPGEIWSVDAIYMAAIMLWNHGDKSTPQEKKQSADRSIIMHRRVIKTYPDSREAAKSSYLVGVLYEWSDRYREAKRILEEVRDRYPSRANDVDRHLKLIMPRLDHKMGVGKNSKK